MAVRQRIVVRALNHPPRHADHGGVVGDRSHATTDPRPDLGMIADADVAEHLRAGADHHSVADGGVALAGILARAAERHALVKQHVVANLGGLPDYYTGAVIDEEAPSDAGSWVNLDSGEGARKLADQIMRALKC